LKLANNNLSLLALIDNIISPSKPQNTIVNLSKLGNNIVGPSEFVCNIASH